MRDLPAVLVGRSADAAVIRVVLPPHLRTLANVDGEVMLDVAGAATQRSVLDALEAEYPMLKGTIRDHATQRAPEVRAVLRATKKTCRTNAPDAPLPEAVVTGAEPFIVVGAMAGG